MLYGLDFTSSKVRVHHFLDNGNVHFDCEETINCDNVKSMTIIDDNQKQNIFSALKRIKDTETFESHGEIIGTVHASASLKYRHDIKSVCDTAGITLKRIIDYPTSAIMAYDFLYEKDNTDEYIALILCFGSDVLDVGMFSCDEGIIQSKECRFSLNTKGTDHQLIAHVIDKIIRKTNISKSNIDKVIITGEAECLENVKEFLVTTYFSGIVTPSIVVDKHLANRGSSIYAAILCGKDFKNITRMLLIETYFSSIGVRMSNNKIQNLVPIYSEIPSKYSLEFSTCYDNQAQMLFDLYEGKNVDIAKNNFIGQILLENINPAPKGIPKVSVMLDMDERGYFTVTATDCETDKFKSITVDNFYVPTPITPSTPADVVVYRPSKPTDEEIRRAMNTK